MEIENNRVASLVTPSSGQSSSVENQQNGHDKTSSENASTSGSDKVSLTGDASRLQELERQLASRPVVDSQHVDAVRGAVENGTFEVNPERIAEKMMSLEQALTDAR
jgi:negative regulator of flagellin synthesis FlgM